MRMRHRPGKVTMSNLRGAKQPNQPKEGTQGKQGQAVTSKQARTDSQTPTPDPNPRHTTQTLQGPRCQRRGGSDLGIQNGAPQPQTQTPETQHKRNPKTRSLHCKRYEDAASSGEGSDEQPQRSETAKSAKGRDAGQAVTSKQARTDSQTPTPDPNPRHTTQTLQGPRCQRRGGSDLGIQNGADQTQGTSSHETPIPDPNPRNTTQTQPQNPILALQAL